VFLSRAWHKIALDGEESALFRQIDGKSSVREISARNGHMTGNSAKPVDDLFGRLWRLGHITFSGNP
jgi:hypothetical protein